jgi:Na+/proline symporter
VLVLVVMAIALWLAIASPAVLVNLLLVAYDGVSQFFPAVVSSRAGDASRRSASPQG